MFESFLFFSARAHVLTCSLACLPIIQKQKRIYEQIHVPTLSRKSPPPAASLAPLPAIVGAVRGGGGGGAGAGAGVDVATGHGGEGPVRAADLVRIGTVVKDRRTVQDIEEDARQSKRRRGF